MAFSAGYLYTVHMSAAFQNLSSTLNLLPFSEQEWMDLIEAIEMDAVDIPRLEEFRQNWKSRYVLQRDFPVYKQMVESAVISVEFKRELDRILDSFVKATTKSTNPLDRLGMIASNLYFLQNFTRAQDAKILSLNFLTHFKKDKIAVDLSRGNLARGISFGLAREGPVSLCTFKGLNVHDNFDFITLENSLEFALLKEYLRLHQHKIDKWDNRINSIEEHPIFRDHIFNLLETRNTPSSFPAVIQPVFFYGTLQLENTTVKLGDPERQIVVEDTSLLKKTGEFHLVEMLEYLRAVFTAFLDPTFINSEETLGVVPIGYKDDVYLIVEYNKLAKDGAVNQRLGLVYHVAVDPNGKSTLSDVCKIHNYLLPELFEMTHLRLLKLEREGTLEPPNVRQVEAQISARVLGFPK